MPLDLQLIVVLVVVVVFVVLGMVEVYVVVFVALVVREVLQPHPCNDATSKIMQSKFSYHKSF